MKTLEQLSDLRARLVRAQRRESAAIRKMTEFTAKGSGDKARFERLLGGVHQARLASVTLYGEWNAAVLAAQGMDEGGGSQPVASTGQDISERPAPP